MWKEGKDQFTQSDRQKAEITMKIQEILSHQQDDPKQGIPTSPRL